MTIVKQFNAINTTTAELSPATIYDRGKASGGRYIAYCDDDTNMDSPLGEADNADDLENSLT